MFSRLRLQGRLLWAHMRRERRRIAWTTAGVAVGVASVVAILTINRSTYRSFEKMVSGLAGRAQLEIVNGAAGVPDDLISALEALPAVSAAAGVVQEFVRAPDLGDREICVLGVDLLQHSAVWEGEFDRKDFAIGNELDLVSEAQAALVSEKLLRDGGYEVGDAFRITTPIGEKRLRIRGVFAHQRFANFFQGDVVVMDLIPAQITFAKEGRFDWIDIVLEPGVDPAAARAQIEPLIAGRAELTNPATRGRRVEAMLFTNRWLLMLSSCFAVSVALFLVCFSMYASVERRRNDLAVLRCVGARALDLGLQVELEALAIATVATVLGIAAGVAVCHVALGSFTAFVSALYAQVRPGGVYLEMSDVGVAAAVGIGAVVLASLLSVSRAVSTPALENLNRYARPNRRTGVTLAGAGALVIIAGLALPSLRLPPYWLGTQTSQAVATVVLPLIGATMMVPALLAVARRPAAALLRALWTDLAAWVWGLLLHARRRTALTLGSLMGGFAFAFFMAVVLVTYRSAVVDYVDRSFPADLIVNVGPGLSLLSGPVVDGAVAVDLARIPGVARARPIRFLEVSFRDRPIVIQGIGGMKPASAADQPSDARGDAMDVTVSETFAERFSLFPGSSFELATPAGAATFRVHAVEADYLLDLGSVKLPWEVMADTWQERRANAFLIDLAKDADPARVKASIDAGVGRDFGLTVLSRRNTREAIELLIQSTFALMFLCQLLAAAVAVIAVVSSVAAALSERERDLLVLRAVGLTPRGALKIALTEGALLGLFGSVFGVVLGGAAVDRVIVDSARTVAGFRLPVVWPYGTAVLLVIFGVASGMLAAYLVARVPTRDATASRLAESKA